MIVTIVCTINKNVSVWVMAHQFVTILYVVIAKIVIKIVFQMMN